MKINKFKSTVSTVAPNPIEAKYWIDIKEDPKGNLVKEWNGLKWVVLNDLSTYPEPEEYTDKKISNKKTKMKPEFDNEDVYFDRMFDSYVETTNKSADLPITADQSDLED